MKYNKGFAAMRLAAAMVALFTLTVIYLFFDPVVEDEIYQSGIDRVDDSRATDMLNKYLRSWQLWVPAFLIAILIYMTTAGQESERVTY